MKHETRLAFLLRRQNLGGLQDCLLQVKDCAAVEIHVDIGSTFGISDSQRSHFQESFEEIAGETKSDLYSASFGPGRALLAMGRLAEMQRKLLEVSAKVILTILVMLKCSFPANDGSRGDGSRPTAPGMAGRKSLQKFPVWYMSTYSLHEHCTFPLVLFYSHVCE
jgi:hypothetical protein